MSAWLSRAATAVAIVVLIYFACLYLAIEAVNRQSPVVFAERQAGEIIARYVRKYRKLPSGWIDLLDQGGDREFEDLAFVAGHVSIHFGMDIDEIRSHGLGGFRYFRGRDGLGDPEKRFAVPVIEAIKSLDATSSGH